MQDPCFTRCRKSNVSTIFDTTTYEAMTAQIVHEVFKTMLRYDIEEAADDRSLQTNIVTSAIFLAGTWKGAVIVECNEEQVRLFTARLMGIPQPACMNDDTRDAMGEVVNMIGGNLKAVLPRGVALSLPSVLEGSDYAHRICGSNRNVRFTFRGEAGTLWVTLVQVNEPGEQPNRSFPGGAPQSVSSAQTYIGGKPIE